MFASSSAASTSSRMQNGHRVDAQHREQQRHAGQRSLAAGQHGQALQPLAGRPHHDLDAAGRLAVLAVAELQGGRAAGEQEPAELVESLADGREGGVELRADLRIELRDQLFGAARWRRSGPRPGWSAPRSRADELAMLLDRERVHRADLRQRPSHAPQLAIQRVVVECGQLGHQLVAGRDGFAGRRLVSPRPRPPRRAPAAATSRARAPAPAPAPPGLLMPRRLDGSGLRLAFQVAQPGGIPAPRAPAPPAPPASGRVRRLRRRAASAAAWSASRAHASTATSSSARSAVESFATRRCCVGDGGLRLHPACGLHRAAARRAELAVLDLAGGCLCGGPRLSSAVALVRGCRPTLAQRGHLAFQRGQRGPRRGVASVIGGRLGASDGGQLLSDARFGGPRSFRREFGGFQIGRRRRVRRARSPRGCAARPPACAPPRSRRPWRGRLPRRRRPAPGRSPPAPDASSRRRP